MKNRHVQAIQVLANTSDSALKHLAYEFAAKHPTSFLRSAGFRFEDELMQVPGFGEITREYYETLRDIVIFQLQDPNVGVIRAIREIRNKTNSGLKNAKEFCDYIRSQVQSQSNA